jgi:hypothetical protein
LILPPDATFVEFREYVESLHGPKGDAEMADLWEWRQKLLGVKVVTGFVAPQTDTTAYL